MLKNKKIINVHKLKKMNFECFLKVTENFEFLMK